MKWFKEEVVEGENGIIIYPNLQTFRQIYTQYVKDQLAKTGEEEDDDDDDEGKRLVGFTCLVVLLHEIAPHDFGVVAVNVAHAPLG